MGGRRPAVFLDYDGTLTPIVDRPEDALISASMRDAVRELAGRCTVCVVSGRDRPVVQKLMGVDDLVVAGSHGFDIWSPEGGEIAHDAAEELRASCSNARPPGCARSSSPSRARSSSRRRRPWPPTTGS